MKEPEIEDSFSKHLTLLEGILKKNKDKECLKACLWGRQILRAKSAEKRTDLCIEFKREHLVIKVMTFILTSFISIQTIAEAYSDIKQLYGSFPEEEFKPHAIFLTKMLYEKVLLH